LVLATQKLASITGRGTMSVNLDSTVNAGTVHRWFEAAAISIREQRDYLTQLDAAIGDADHGTNMDRGFTAVVEKLEGLDDTPPGKLLTTVGSTLVSTVGGASGPLWGMALRRAGRALGSGEEFEAEQLADGLEAALEGVVELGAAQEGDKTMVDALAPATRAFREAVGNGAALSDALTAARVAAEEGMKATVPLQAQKGRASYLGERSIGHQDPGATSTVLILAALEQSVAADR
jgi:phosphoenolpyruvate---glycerone phosphotransferase subunit DhaL